jgi:glycosyltransferase involved in cell wall biosynthesis
MKILIFAAYFPPRTGGYEAHVFELSKRLVKRGHRADVVTCTGRSATNPGSAQIPEESDGVSVYRLPSWNILGGDYPLPKPGLTTFRILFTLLGKDYDLVNTQGRLFATSVIGLVFAKMKRARLLHTEHAVKPGSRTKLRELVRIIVDYTLGRLIIGSAWKTIGVSGDVCNFLRAMGAKKAVLIHNGVDTSVFREKVREKLDDTVTVTFVGRLVRSKGVQDLTPVFSELGKRYEARLLIVGDGPYKPELERLAHGVDGENILFLGHKDQREVAAILRSSDIFVNPSYSEGLPTSVLEAGAAGLAIVATDVGGTREIVEDGKSGFLVSPGDTRALKERVCQLVKDRQLREDFGRRIRQFVNENFDWDNIVDKWIAEVISAG